MTFGHTSRADEITETRCDLTSVIKSGARAGNVSFMNLTEEGVVFEETCLRQPKACENPAGNHSLFEAQDAQEGNLDYFSNIVGKDYVYHSSSSKSGFATIQMKVLEVQEVAGESYDGYPSGDANEITNTKYNVKFRVDADGDALIYSGFCVQSYSGD